MTSTSPLEASLRKTLEKRIVEARAASEAAARTALEALAVHETTFYPSMSEEQRLLRRRLRARARVLKSQPESDLSPLVEELAYVRWHRFLFARFLLANDLLMHPEYAGVAVSLSDCAELAPEENAPDGWAVASLYAQKMLPAVFRDGDPLLEVRLFPEGRRAMIRAMEGIPEPAFTSADGLGWTYQFWQTDAKKEVNASGRKIGGADIPAVTQLFTEDYMVDFLLQNSLGAWWAHRNPESPLVDTFSYLRWSDDDAGAAPAGAEPMDETGREPRRELDGGAGVEAGNSTGTPRTPAAGTFDGWPDTAAEVTVLDPCCGSGHFVVAAAEMLALMRSEEEEGLSAAEAADAVLGENVYGLELDGRCAQIAAFSLALWSWKRGGFRTIPSPNIACSGTAAGGRPEEWRNLAAGNHDLENTLENLHKLFQNAPDLGSLIDPARVAEGRGFAKGGTTMLGHAPVEDVDGLLGRALSTSRGSSPNSSGSGDDLQDASEFAGAARGIARAASLMRMRYTLVATNVPYLARGKQSSNVRDHLSDFYANGKADLATAFVLRCRDYTASGGSYALVTPQNWLFLGTYKNLRERLLKEQSWNLVARLGPKGFQTPMWDFNVMLITLTNTPAAGDHRMSGLDVSDYRTPDQKAHALKTAPATTLPQSGQLENPDFAVSLNENERISLLSKHARSVHGLTTGDKPMMSLSFWELERISSEWNFFQTSVEEGKTYDGRTKLLRWHGGTGPINELLGARKDGGAAWGKKGVIVSQMRQLPAAVYTGEVFDNVVAAIVPKDERNLKAVYAFCTSPDFNDTVRLSNQKMNVDSGYFEKVPFDLERWQKVARERYPDGLPEPYSSDPTQWLFHGHPANASAGGALQVAVARLLGYRWPAEAAGEAERMGISAEGRAWLSLAAREDLAAHTDPDGIVCLPAVAGERPAAERLRALLAEAWKDAPGTQAGAGYGAGWSPAVLDRLLQEAGSPGKDLAAWLSADYFRQHARLFHNRPFVWHVTDGRPGGFSALVNYHRLDERLLGRLTYTYLGDWIEGQRTASENGETGADLRLAAATELQRKLIAIIEGQPPYDLYIRWKKKSEQPIGWNPDTNDGVRLNIRPFIEAGVLRSKFTINWKKDRGKNPDGTERHNDLHLTREEKEEARRKMDS